MPIGQVPARGDQTGGAKEQIGMNNCQSQLRRTIGTRVLLKVVGSLLLILLVLRLVDSILIHDLSASLTGRHGDESIIRGTGARSQPYNATEGFAVEKNHTSETELPNWLKTYFRWHSNQLELIENSTSEDLARFRFIVVVCLEGIVVEQPID